MSTWGYLHDFWPHGCPWEAPVLVSEPETTCPKCGAETMGTSPVTYGLFVACKDPDCNRHIRQPESGVKRARWREWLEWWLS